MWVIEKKGVGCFGRRCPDLNPEASLPDCLYKHLCAKQFSQVNILTSIFEQYSLLKGTLACS